MARRRKPVNPWRIGDPCEMPWYVRGHVRGWERAQVVAIRGNNVVVHHYGWERVYPWWEIRRPTKRRRTDVATTARETRAEAPATPAHRMSPNVIDAAGPGTVYRAGQDAPKPLADATTGILGRISRRVRKSRPKPTQSHRSWPFSR